MSLHRSAFERVVAFALVASFALQPLPALASAADDDIVVKPDAAYVAFELQSSRESLGAATKAFTATRAFAVHSVIPESRIQRLPARPYTPFAQIDPTTGKPVSATTMISVPANPPPPGPNGEPGGKPGGHRQVPAGQYWSQVNQFEKAATASGATVRDTRPILTTHVSGLQPGAYSASEVARVRSYPAAPLPDAAQLAADGVTLSALKAGVIGTYPRNILFKAPPKPLTEEQLLLKLQAKMVALHDVATLAPCVNAPTYTFEKIPTLSGDEMKNFNALNVIGPLPTPSPFLAKSAVTTPVKADAFTIIKPTPSPGPGQLPAAAQAFAPTAAQFALMELKLEQAKCPNPISPLPKSYGEADLASFLGKPPGQPPLDIPFGDKSVAALELTGDVKIGGAKTSTGAPAPTLTGNVMLLGYLFDNSTTLASAVVQTGGPGASSLTVMLAGKTVFSPTLASGDNKDSKAVNETFFAINVPIPLFAGLNLDLAASVTGSLTPSYDLNISQSSLSDTLNVSLNAALNGVFSAALDVDFEVFDISVGVQISLTFLSLTATATGGIALAMIDRPISSGDTNPRDIRDCQLNLQYEDGVGLKGTALQGTISFFIQECVDYFIGSSCAQQGFTLASWPGFPINAGNSDPKWKSIPLGPYYTDGPEYGIPLKNNEVYSADDKTAAVPAACYQFPINYGT